MRFTAKELSTAAAWAKHHVDSVHAGDLPYADFAIRNLDGGGIGQRALLTCEACDRIRGKAGQADHNKDITDYEAW